MFFLKVSSRSLLNLYDLFCLQNSHISYLYVIDHNGYKSLCYTSMRRIMKLNEIALKSLSARFLPYSYIKQEITNFSRHYFQTNHFPVIVHEFFGPMPVINVSIIKWYALSVRLLSTMSLESPSMRSSHL